MENYVSVIGGINIDIKGVPLADLLPETSNPGSVSTSPGGVGRNIAHNLALLGVPVYLFGVIGNDEFGSRVLSQTKVAGVDVTYVQILNDQPTGMYLSILDASRNPAVAIADMEITHGVDPAYLDTHREVIQHSSFVVVDTNVDPAVLGYVCELCQQAHIPCLVEPVSVEKAKKFHALNGDCDYLTPNRAELGALCQRPIEHLHQLEAACAQLSHKCRQILVTLDEDGVYSYSREQQTGKFYPPFKTRIVDPNGAGDAFVAGFVCGLSRHFEMDDAIQLGMAAAHLTLQSEDTVSEKMSFAACSALAP